MLTISTSVRHAAAVNLLSGTRWYGRISFLSEQLEVSPRWLGELNQRLHQAIEPRRGGRPRRDIAVAAPPQAQECCCGRRCPGEAERERRRKAVALRLSVSPCSLRDTSDVLELAFGESVSRQWIADLIHRAGRKAREVQEAINLRAGIVQAAADEIFAGKKPILTVVEPVSLALLDAVRSDHRRGDDWEAVLKRYPKLKRVASDCGTGLLAGIRACELEHQPDPFHALHELYASLKRLQGLAYQAIDHEYDALGRLHRARRKGDDLRPATQQHRHACRKAREAIRRYDLAAWLARELHQALDVPDRTTQEHLAGAAATIRTAVQLLGELGVPRLRRIQTYFEPEKMLSFLRWALAHPDQPLMRGSSCVEAVNSFLRTDQTVKKHLDQDYLDLLRWFYNMRPFSTGQRQRRSPLQLLGIQTPYRSWLDPLID